MVDAKKRLDLMVGSRLKFAKADKAVFEKDFFLQDKYPARVLEFDAPSGWNYRWYLILTPDHAYQIGVLGSRKFVVSGKAYQFLSSFKVVE